MLFLFKLIQVLLLATFNEASTENVIDVIKCVTKSVYGQPKISLALCWSRGLNK